jgi:hypothetical protein
MTGTQEEFMRTVLFALASGIVLSLAAPAVADETMPDATRYSTPQPVSATQVDTGKYCHYLVHEGAMTVERCRSAQSWEETRLRTQQAIIDFQLHSYVAGSGH